MAKAPAFQLYAADFYMDTVSWDVETVGVYTRLLFYQWVNGSIPNDLEKIARIAGCLESRKWRANMVRIWQELSPKFVLLPDGNLVNVRLEETRKKQDEYKEKQTESGRLGGLKAQEKRRCSPSDTPSEPPSNPSSENEALQSSSSPSKDKPILKYITSSSEVELSELLFSFIQKRDPKQKSPDYQKWAVHIDRLIRLDNRGPTEIRAVIEWCQKDLFWQNNILSTEKLREQFQQLILKMKGNGNGKTESGRSGAGDSRGGSGLPKAPGRAQSDGEPWPVDVQ